MAEVESPKPFLYELKPLKSVSPSRIRDFLECNRYWWWNVVVGVDVPQSSSASGGDKLHAEMEGYLKTGKIEGLSPLARLGIPYLPAGGSPGLGIERWIRDNRFDPALRGKIDLIHTVAFPKGQTIRISDHKTVGNARYAKRSEDLVSDLQMGLYAAWTFQEFPLAAEAGKVELEHIQYFTKTGQVKPIRAMIERTQADTILSRSLATVEKMREASKTADPREIRGSLSKCDRWYGKPCFFAGRCAALSRTSIFQGIGVIGPHEKGLNMSLTDELFASIRRRGQGAVQALVNPPHPAALAVAPPSVAETPAPVVARPPVRAFGINPPEKTQTQDIEGVTWSWDSSSFSGYGERHGKRFQLEARAKRFEFMVEGSDVPLHQGERDGIGLVDFDGATALLEECLTAWDKAVAVAGASKPAPLSEARADEAADLDGSVRGRAPTAEETIPHLTAVKPDASSAGKRAKTLEEEKAILRDRGFPGWAVDRLPEEKISWADMLAMDAAELATRLGKLKGVGDVKVKKVLDLVADQKARLAERPSTPPPPPAAKGSGIFGNIRKAVAIVPAAETTTEGTRESAGEAIELEAGATPGAMGRGEGTHPHGDSGDLEAARGLIAARDVEVQALRKRERELLAELAAVRAGERPAEPEGFTLYIDCAPTFRRDGEPAPIFFHEVLEPYKETLCGRLGVADPLLVDFGKGAPGVAVELKLNPPVARGSILVDSRDPYWPACKPFFLARARVVVTG